MPPIRWHEVPGLPPAAAAVLSGLAFRNSPSSRTCFSRKQWDEALAFADQMQVTLTFGSRCREQLPPEVRRRIQTNFENNTRRLARLKQEYFEIAARLDSLGIDHVLLKGFLQAPRFLPNPQLRAQYDLDILCTPAELPRAQLALAELGFEEIGGGRRATAGHLPPLTRKTGWRWKGDYFDPEMPPLIDLHFQLWDEATERFAIAGIEEFWDRRTQQPFEGRQVPSLREVDQFGYAAIHALRHLLRGDLKVFHIYELGYFLENHAGGGFAEDWRKRHPAPARSLQAVPLLLAERWFSCRVPETVREAAEELPRDVRVWLEHYAAAPVLTRFHPNKDELWLHLCLLPAMGDKARVLRRRLLPLSRPAHVEAAFVPEKSMSTKLRVLKWLRYCRHLLSRMAFHTRSLASVLASGLHWRRRSSSRGSERG